MSSLFKKQEYLRKHDFYKCESQVWVLDLKNSFKCINIVQSLDIFYNEYTFLVVPDLKMFHQVEIVVYA